MQAVQFLGVVERFGERLQGGGVDGMVAVLAQMLAQDSRS